MAKARNDYGWKKPKLSPKKPPESELDSAMIKSKLWLIIQICLEILKNNPICLVCLRANSWLNLTSNSTQILYEWAFINDPFVNHLKNSKPIF